MTTAWRYTERPIGLMERWQVAPTLTAKVYGISTTGPLPRPELVAAAKAVAAEIVPTDPDSETVPAAAILICHDAGESCWALVQWWVSSCILRSFVYRADGDAPGHLSPAPAGITACVWELEVVDFERRAWTEHMLKSHSPSLDAYMAAELHTVM